MPNARTCDLCRCFRPWTEDEKFAYIERVFRLIRRVPNMDLQRGNCTKIPPGKEWTQHGITFSYGGYSLEGECYDEVFHCFEGGK